MSWKRLAPMVIALTVASWQACADDATDGAHQKETLHKISAANAASLQGAIDANPGRMIFVPQGEYRLDQPLRITTDGTGLYGYGVIIQQNASVPILLISGANDVRIRSLTFRRSNCREMDRANGVVVEQAKNVVLDHIRVRDHKVQGHAIAIRGCSNCAIRDSEVINYKQIAIDDRTGNAMQGYAFRCIDGTGIYVSNSTGTVISGNRIIEQDLLPSKAIQEKYELGRLVPGRHPTVVGELGKRAVRNGNYVDLWHQGAAIFVGNPRASRQTLITDNYIENAAQGIDMHSDNAICSGNTIHNASIGIKATHGSRNLILNSNLLAKIDRWGIVLSPGAGSSHSVPAHGTQLSKPANVDGGTVISNNIITEFGEGYEYWHLGGAYDDRGSSYGIAFLAAQLSSNPPLRDILVTGNVVYDTTADEISSASGDPPPRPKYRFAVAIEHEQGKPDPVGMHFGNNVFHPGTEGISNVELPP